MHEELERLDANQPVDSFAAVFVQTQVWRLPPLPCVRGRVATEEQGVEVRVLSAKGQITPAGGQQPGAGLVDTSTGGEQMLQELLEPCAMTARTICSGPSKWA